MKQQLSSNNFDIVVRTCEHCKDLPEGGFIAYIVEILPNGVKCESGNWYSTSRAEVIQAAVDWIAIAY